MGKIAFIFSGQGAQYVGMGKDLYENYDVSKNIFEIANETLNMDLKKLCFEGPEQQLNETENTQPAIVTVTLSALEALKQNGIKADVAAGLSLGEYSALTYSGVFDIKDVIPLVKKRGKYMQEAVPIGVGKMVAVLGLSEDKVLQACEESKDFGTVEAANFNCPGQIVIGGEVNAVNAASQKALEKGALKTVTLPVSAPFHTSMLAPASEKIAKELEKIELKQMNVPVITNVTANYIKDISEIKPLLEKQVKSPVLWEQIIRRMISDGVDTFVEIGPGRTLSTFVKKVDRKLKVFNVEDMKSLNKTVEALGGNKC